MATIGDTEGLQPQDLVLTVFGAYVRDPGDTVWSGGMVEILEGFGFTTASARAALARTVHHELLERSRNGRRAFYSLTPRAKALLEDGDGRILDFGRAKDTDERWTVLWHVIPDTQRVQRARLAARLRFLGFGSVQDATWIAAHDREEDVLKLLRQLELVDYVTMVVGQVVASTSRMVLASQAWRLDDLADRYSAFLDDFGRCAWPQTAAASAAATLSTGAR